MTQKKIGPATAIGDIVSNYPATRRILEERGVDYCCGGARTLKDLRRDLGVTRDCGRCASCARDCLQEANAGQNKPGKSLRKTA